MALFDALQDFLGSSLAFFYDLAPSFGVSIILLTITINLVLFPLTLRQTRATRAFQSIQPEIKRIQKEHKEDPETLQKELMRVQKEAGATPGGCLLPLLIQFPIWLALFRVLNGVSQIAGGNGAEPHIPADSGLWAAIEAGQTQFLGMGLGTTMSSGVLGGIPAALPYVLMLVLMVASQYFQQWHAQRGQNSAQALTAQQKQQQQTQQMITRVMPLFIGFISWNFPAGLVLYWTTSNIFRLGQQFVIFAIDGRPTTAADPSGSETKAGEEEAPPKKPQPVSEKKKRRRRK